MASSGSGGEWFDSSEWIDSERMPGVPIPANAQSFDEPGVFDLDKDQSEAWDSGTWRGGFCR